MNALTSRQLSPLFAIACRSTGAIMIVATLINMIVLPMPYEFQDREWILFRFITPLVDRGIIALLGIVLILGSCWINSLGKDGQANARNQSSLPFVSFVIAVLFSVFFMLMLVLHLVNLSQWRTAQIAEVAEQAAQAESQLEQQVDQQKELIGTLFENTGLRQEAIAQGQIPNEVVALLENLDSNPDGFTAFEEQVEQGLVERQTDINIRRQELQNEVANRALRSGLMTGLDSLLLAIGFGIISWTGFRLSK